MTRVDGVVLRRLDVIVIVWVGARDRRGRDLAWHRLVRVTETVEAHHVLVTDTLPCLGPDMDLIKALNPKILRRLLANKGSDCHC